MANLTYQHRSVQTNQEAVSQRQTGGKVLQDNRQSSKLKQLMVQRMVEEEEPLQGKFANQNTAQLEQQTPTAPNNTGLPDNLKYGIESLSGLSMDNVKVHYNSAKPAQLNALAYAQGTDIHVASGQEKHLPHEAWHVVQQMQGRVKPTMQMKGGVAVNDDARLEKEADVMGVRATSSKFVANSIQTKKMTQTVSIASQFMSTVQRQQTDVCLKSATGTYDHNGGNHNFTFSQGSKGSDVILTTKSHPSGKVDYSEKVKIYLKGNGTIPREATNIVLTDYDTYGIKK